MNLGLGLGLNNAQRGPSGPPPAITGTSPVLAPLTAGQQLSASVTWGTYASSAGTVNAPTRQMQIDGGAWVAYVASRVVAAGETFAIREIVTDSAANSRTFNSQARQVPAATTVLSYFGGEITYTVTGQTGQYADGSFWATGDVIDMAPAFDTNVTRTLANSTTITSDVHGWMVDPGNAAAWKSGDLTTLAQRQAANYGNGAGGTNQAYDSWDGNTTNLAYDAANRAALPIASGAVVKARSRITGVSNTARPALDYKAVLTLVDTAPPAGSIRPPIARADKTPVLNTSQINLSRLRNLDVSGIAERPTFQTLLNWLSGTHTFQHSRNVNSRNIVPPNGLGLDPYFGDTAEEWSQVLLAMHTNALTTEQKTTLAIQIGKIASDIAAAVYEGRIFAANGGHSHGRLPILAFAAELFNSAYLRDACSVVAASSIANEVDAGQSVYGGDLGQLYYVTQEIIDASQSSLYPFPQEALGYPTWTERNFGGTLAAEVANIMGNQFGTSTALGNAPSYAPIVNKSAAANSLALRLLQGVTPAVPQLFHDHADRWIGFEVNDLYAFPEASLVKPTINLTVNWVRAAYAAFSPLVDVWTPPSNNETTIGILGQSELDYLFNPEPFYRKIIAPVVTEDGVRILYDASGANATVKNTSILTVTNANRTTLNPGSIALANTLTHILPGRQFNFVDFAVPGTGLRALLDDADTNRSWAVLDDVRQEAEAEFGNIDLIAQNWWNSTSSQLKTFPETFAPGIFGQRWNGSAFALGSTVTDGIGGYDADHCFWDITAPPDQVGRGIFTRNRTKYTILGPGPLLDAPDSVAATRYADAGSRPGQLDRPARNRLAEFMADSRVQTFGAGYGISTHVCKFGDRYDPGGSADSTNIHPSVRSPDGQYLFGQHMAIGIAQALGAAIFEPQITGISMSPTGAWADVIVSLPNGGTLTTIRTLRAEAAPDPAPPHWQPVVGFEIGADAATVLPTGFTAVIQDSGSGSPRTGRVRITPTVPFDNGQVIEYLRGSASAILLQTRDLVAALYKDFLIEHVPALQVPGDSYPYPGIPVKPQPATLVVSGVTPNAPMTNAVAGNLATWDGDPVATNEIASNLAEWN